MLFRIYYIYYIYFEDLRSVSWEIHNIKARLCAGNRLFSNTENRSFSNTEKRLLSNTEKRLFYNTGPPGPHKNVIFHQKM